MRILIADDNTFYRTLLTNTVEQWGHETVVAVDGEEACRIFQEKDPPRIALLDWVMPGMTGLEVCQKIRTLSGENPPYVIILTVKNTKADLLTALRCGADDYLAKPFDREELHARLQVGLRIAKLQDQLSRRVDTLENALSRSQKLEWIGSFAGGIAHDFNNILTIIKGYCELISFPDFPPELRGETIQTILEATNRGAALTRQLLTFARKQENHPVNLNLNTSVSNVQKMLDKIIGEDIRVSLTLESNLGTVKADPTQIELVLINLLVNARDSMVKGGSITLSTTNLEINDSSIQEHPGGNAGSFVMMSVADTGCGMDDATKARLFEPFFTTKLPGKGTGLGLATSYGIIRQSGGFIEVESEKGVGTCFRIYLPRIGDDEISMPVPLITSSSKVLGETVLIVEDEDPVRRFLRTLLTGRGYHVLDASSGEEALRICRECPGPIDLMLSDIIMPNMNGYETAERLQAIRPKIQVLFLSGYAEDDVRFNENSSIPRLQKPIASEQLLGAIRKVLDQK